VPSPTPLIVKVSAFLLGVLIATSGTGTPVPVPVDPTSTMSGFAANALIRAYDSERRSGTPAPFRLQPYIVQIGLTGGGDFEVDFIAETTDKFDRIYVQGQTGAIGPSSLLKLVNVEATTLPGIVAGAIIAAYKHAVVDPQLTATHIAMLTAGSYNLVYQPLSGTTYVSFVWLSRGPSVLSLQPAPTTQGAPECSPGNCDDRVAYFVDVRNNRVRVWNAARLP